MLSQPQQTLLSNLFQRSKQSLSLALPLLVVTYIACRPPCVWCDRTSVCSSGEQFCPLSARCDVIIDCNLVGGRLKVEISYARHSRGPPLFVAASSTRSVGRPWLMAGEIIIIDRGKPSILSLPLDQLCRTSSSSSLFSSP